VLQWTTTRWEDVNIPARRLDLRAKDSHVGFARGHVVTEAWIDDLNRWVVLDRQNGAWWARRRIRSAGTRSSSSAAKTLHDPTWFPPDAT
jgi:hypothetical protein